MPSKAFVPLLHNARFYILSSAVILSFGIAAALRLQVASDQLYYIRLEQVYGLLAVIYLYTAVVLSPLQKALGPRVWLQYAVFARRAIGVTAAYYSVLHFAVALWGQIGGLGGIRLLPSYFVWSLVFGIIAMLILLAMAATSFDVVIKRMTFRRWKLLHRLIYAGGILIILHVWMIGTHIIYGWAQLGASLAMAALLGLEAIRLAKQLGKRFPKVGRHFAISTIGIWLTGMALLAAIPLAVDRYHADDHSSPAHQDTHQGKNHE